jgi:hypothetical protein
MSGHILRDASPLRQRPKDIKLAQTTQGIQDVFFPNVKIGEPELISFEKLKKAVVGTQLIMYSLHPEIQSRNEKLRVTASRRHELKR